MGQQAVAFEYYEDLLRYLLLDPDANPKETCGTLELVAELYLFQRNLDQSLNYYKEALNIHRRTQAVADEQTIRLINHVISVLYELSELNPEAGHDREAERYRAELSLIFDPTQQTESESP